MARRFNHGLQLLEWYGVNCATRAMAFAQLIGGFSIVEISILTTLTKSNPSLW